MTTLIRALDGFPSDHKPVEFIGDVPGAGEVHTITYNAQYCPKRPGKKHRANRRRHEEAFDHLAALGPIAINVNEAAGYRKKLRQVDGYRAIHPRGAAGKNALLIRNDVKVHATGKFKVTGRRLVGRDVPGARITGWTAARWLVWALVTNPATGKLVIVAGWHPVPGQSHSDRARRLLGDQASAGAAWIRRQRRPVDLMGDTNGRPELALFAPLKRVATPYFAASRGKAPIDGHWISKG